MSVNYHFNIYIGTDIENLFSFVETEVMREPRFDAKTGKQVEDYVETKITPTPLFSELDLQSKTLCCLRMTDYGVNFEELYYGEEIVSDSIIGLKLFESGAIYNNTITPQEYDDWFTEIQEIAIKFQQLTGYAGKLTTYFVEQVG